MHEILITVITPTYNRAHVIRKAINSMLVQSYTNFEYLIVDDGSIDNTDELIKQINDPRIIYIKCPINKGQSAALNIGIDAAKGEFITFLDSDDEFVPNRLEWQYEKFKKSDCKNLGVVTGGRIDVDHTGKEYYKWNPSLKGELLIPLITGKRIGAGPPFLMFKREVFQKHIRFDETLKSVKELDLLINVFLHGYTMDFIDKPVLRVHHGEGPRTFNFKNATIARIKIFEKYQTVFADKKVNKKYLYRTFLYALFSKEQTLIDEVKDMLGNNGAYIGKFAWSIIPQIKNKKARNAYIKFLRSIYY